MYVARFGLGGANVFVRSAAKSPIFLSHGKNAPHPVYIAFVFLIIFAECDAAEHLQDIADGCFIVRAARHCRFVFYHWVFQRWYVPFGLKTAEQRRKVAFAMNQLIR